MFGFNKKMNEMMKKSPQEALDVVQKDMTKGIGGLFYKTFMGKEGFERMNNAFESARHAADMADAYKRGDLPNGLPATAEVVSINDTGQLVNFNPVVVMQLKVQPQFEAPFETTTATMVSKIAIPKVGDTINIKYNPGDRTNIVVVVQ